MRVDGREHMPRHGPAIVAANHSGLLDGPAVHAVAGRGVHFLIKEELSRGIGGRIFLAAGQIPVARASGRGALEAALEVLRAGRVVGIFPEGTRGAGRASTIRAGVGWLAVHSGAPVIPVACLGTRRDGESPNHVPTFRRRVAVSFGSPLDISPALALGVTREAVGVAIDVIGRGLAAHVAETEARTGIALPTR
jgi:1-acyl-sn-glycerol-3-phosphate acyltransferase